MSFRFKQPREPTILHQIKEHDLSLILVELVLISSKKHDGSVWLDACKRVARRGFSLGHTIDLIQIMSGF